MKKNKVLFITLGVLVVLPIVLFLSFCGYCIFSDMYIAKQLYKVVPDAVKYDSYSYELGVRAYDVDCYKFSTFDIDKVNNWQSSKGGDEKVCMVDMGLLVYLININPTTAIATIECYYKSTYEEHFGKLE
jgi:hypothetical protein